MNNIELSLSRFAQLGIDSETDRELAKQIRLTNVLAAITASLCLAYSIIFLLVRVPILGYISLPLTFVYATILLLNHWRKHFLSRLLFVLFYNLGIFVYSTAIEDAAGLALMFFPLLSLPLILFDTKRRILILLGVLLSVGLYFVVYLTDFSVIPIISVGGSSLRSLFIIASLTSQSFLFVAIAYFYVQNQRNERLLSAMAQHDPLTGLHNRQYFDDAYRRHFMISQRQDYRLALLMFDIDFFKGYNDLYGHQRGDWSSPVLVDR